MSTRGPYRIDLRPSVAAALRDLGPNDRRRIGRKINSLATEPRPRGCEKLEGEPDLYRIRSGDFRNIYQIQDAALVVLIVRGGNRRDVCRNLPE